MAEFTLSGGSPTAEVDASAAVVSETDTTATIRVTMWARLKYSSANVWSSGVKGQANVDGVVYDQQRIFGVEHSHSGNAWQSVTRDRTVSKGSSGRNVGWAAYFHSWVDDVDLGTKATLSGNVWIGGITYYAPNAPSGCSVARNSDSKSTVSWTAPSTTTTKPVSAILVERQIDGGSWSQIASVGGSTTSYADTGTSADHSYRYRVRAQNSAGTSGYSTSGTVYNTPAAPKKVTASRLAATTVKVSIENAARTATSLELQRSKDKSAWEDVATVEGSPVTETTDEPGGGTFYYRARNKRGSLVSAWSAASDAVVTICPPAAPTLLAPASGMVVSKAEENVAFSWAHNPIDGSAQTAAQLRWSVDGGASWTTEQIDGAAASCEVDNAFAVNSEVTWSVRTKGADADYGPWSGNRVFRVCQAPALAFTAPTDGFIVENTPIAIQLQYDDPSGSLASLKLKVLDADGNAVYSLDMGTSTTASITSSDWVPDDGGTYTLRAEARSSSSLTATAERAFSVDFELPMTAGVTVSPDPETGRVSLSVFVVDDEALQPPDHVVVYRERGGERVLLGDELTAGAAVVDMYAPLNVGYSYVVVSVADSGAASTHEYPARIDTPFFFMMHGDAAARLKWDPSGQTKISRPNRRRQHYAGRALPVSYDDGSVSDTRSLSFTIRDEAEAEALDDLMRSSGRCVYKSGDGEVMHADAEVTLKQAWASATRYGTASVSLTRIDGGDL